uniref:orotate phosphoribosyltransferase n=1 Tax=viral metagenome TaxID=1070528 RepID=A0A6M3K3F7_9ZZZZ
MDRAFLRGDIVLSFGERSDYYIDMRMIEVTSEGAYLIGEVLFDQIKDLDFNAIGGLAVGAVPLVTSVVITCFHRGREVEGFWVREKAKGHGTRKLIEGNLPKNARVVIVDDVITSGQSVLKAIRTVEAEEAEILLVVSIIDRERGASKLFSSEGYEYKPIFMKRDLIKN